MKPTNLVTVGALAVAASLVAAQPAAKPAASYTALAEKIVGTSAHVKEGEVVEISGGLLDLALLEDLAVAVRKRGAFPLLTITTDRIAKSMNTAIPAKYDAQVPTLDVQLANIVDVYISIPAVRDPGIAAMLSPERTAKRAKAARIVDARQRNHAARIVELDNGLAPSWTRANELGVAEAELARMFWEGLNADYTVVETACKTLRAQLARGGNLRITHANGTNLALAIPARRTFVNDGITSQADLAAGGPGLRVWLPAGDVYAAPVPGTARGRLIDDRMIAAGKEVTGIVIDVARGRTTSIVAKSGWDALNARYAAAGPGKLEISSVDLGCNPAIPTAGKLETRIGAGMVTLGVGGNAWAGGTNGEPFELAFQLPGATVTLDGKVLVENGKLK